MSDRIVTPDIQEERAELEKVAETLARSPRLQRLLRFMGDRYFSGGHDQLREFNIAVELFGRPAGRFDPNSDAIVRVEAHRLRKRLKEFYETEGRDHSLRIRIPLGCYVPEFSRNPDPEPEFVRLPEASVFRPPIPEAESVTAKPGRSSLLLWVLLAIVIVFAGSGLRKWLFRDHSSHRSQADGVGLPPAKRDAIVPEAPYTFVPLRLMAGYTGPFRLDSSGNEWMPDQFFHGGRPALRQAATTFRTNRPMLFRQWRNGEFSYDIPLRPGTYELHLYFVASHPPQEADTEETDTFSVSINGKLVLKNFDIESDALGTDVADERVFKDVQPAPDGTLHISLQGEQSLPFLNAIEVLPGIPHEQQPIRIVVQPTPFADHDGQFWGADDFYEGGRVSSALHPVLGTSDPALFSRERYGHFTYTIPVDQQGRYSLTLHFGEFYFGPDSPGGGGIGSRLFNVTCNGVLLLKQFDIYKEAGAFKAVTETFHHLEPTAQGKLNLTFEPVVNNATVSGIEVLDESR